MFNLKDNITITQSPSKAYPNHNKVIRMDFMESYEWISSWDSMTDKGKITIPKNLFYKDESNLQNPLNGTKVNIGGFGSEPLIMRGDKVILEAGYNYFKPSLNRRITEESKIIEGYISKVHAKIPIEFDIEDNMWLLKQTPLSNRTFNESDTLETILKWVIESVNKIHKTNLTFRALTETNFGALMVRNETASQLLNRLKHSFGFRSYFRGNELRCGIIIYFHDEAEKQIFIMNGSKGNVCAEGQELEFQRKDDITLSAIAHNTVEQETGANCKDGTAKKKKVRLEVLVSIKNDVETIKVIGKGERVPDNEEGERRTLFYPGANNTDQLAKLALDELKRYYYTGLKGSFMSMGIPFVKHGDLIQIQNPKQPEQDGIYKVKSVRYTGGANGLRQQIELDYKINV
jgi:hypothetical protein